MVSDQFALLQVAKEYLSLSFSSPELQRFSMQIFLTFSFSSLASSLSLDENGTKINHE